MRDFPTLFSCLPTVIADAPGRVNLIGEHTDYNGGFVLPTAIPQRTRVELSPRVDNLVRVWSDAPGCPEDRVEYRLGMECAGQGWLDYVQGVTRVLGDSGRHVSGFNARLASAVPVGSGLSSSAALSVALLRALREAFHLDLDDVAIAEIGQKSENSFVGAQVGIMDPMAASLADERTALFLDCRSLQFERVPLPVAADLVVINSGVAHNHAAGDYNTRRSECERACALLGVRQLRDLTSADLPRIAALPEPLNRRARHVVTENDRVLAAVAALKAGHLDRVGQLFHASHASMRDDYAVSVPEIDLLAELAQQDADVIGARLTGGGFGGSVVVLSRAGTGRTVAERVATLYAQQSGRTPRILVPANPS
jgi:galactokinase